jgi:hypothetical protein
MPIGPIHKRPATEPVRKHKHTEEDRQVNTQGRHLTLQTLMPLARRYLRPACFTVISAMSRPILRRVRQLLNHRKAVKPAAENRVTANRSPSLTGTRASTGQRRIRNPGDAGGPTGRQNIATQTDQPAPLSGNISEMNKEGQQPGRFSGTGVNATGKANQTEKPGKVQAGKAPGKEKPVRHSRLSRGARIALAVVAGIATVATVITLAALLPIILGPATVPVIALAFTVGILAIPAVLMFLAKKHS